MTRHLFCIMIITLICAVLGCSGGGDNAIAPVEPTSRDVETTGSHVLWGLYQFKADPVAQVLEAVPLRMADMHLNALPFLEPPMQVYLTLENIGFNGNIIEVDIGLRHPFLGLDKYTGFDVAGILITSGSVTGFDDADIIMAGEGDARLLNPDGWTRWWNPSEFPINNGTIFSYTDGLLGKPDSIGDYSCTLNGYKYFCDDLSSPDAPLSEVDPAGRGVFGAGQKNVRHYSIDMGSGGLVFNYAVDASWRFPSGPGPWIVPDDFGPTANKPEAWRLDISESDNTLWNDGIDNGGDLTLLVDVYDWFNADMNTVKIESSGNFPVTAVSTATSGGVGYSTYEIEITDATPQNSGDIELFITATCEVDAFGGLLPGKLQASYAFHTVLVDDESPQEETTEWITLQHDARHSGLADVNGPQTNSVKYTQLHMTGNGVNVLTGPGAGIYGTFFGSIYANRPLYAVDRTDGSLIWSEDYDGPESTYVRALCIDPEDGWIYAYYSGNGTIHKLDPADGSDLTTPVSGYSLSAGSYGVLHDNGNLDVITGNDIVRGLDPDDLSQQWSTSVGFFGNGSPAIGIDGSIIVYANNSVRCLDEDTGAILWSASTGNSQGTPTVLSDGVIIMTTQSGAVYAINSDGTPKWNVVPLPGYRFDITSAAEGPDGDIYVVANNGSPEWLEQLIRLDPDDGSQVNASGTSYNMKSSSIPAIGADGTIYINGSTRIFAFNPDCTLNWQSSTVGGIYGGQSLGACAIDSNGDLYAVSGTHGFICISDS